MYDKELVREILSQILTAADRIERRSSLIHVPDDFISSDDGIDKLDAISMMLIAIGEGLKHLDKLTNEKLLSQYPEIDWKGAKGVRYILSHHYFDINAEVVFTICKEYIPNLTDAIKQMINDL